METHERIGWVDAIRGAGTIAVLTIAARWILHPRAHLMDPTVVRDPTPTSTLWWTATDTVADETGIWLMAIAAGVGLAAAREQDPGAGWRNSYYSRAALITVLGAAWSLGVWAGDILLGAGLVMLFIGATVQDRTVKPWGIAIIAGLIGAIAGLPWADGQGLLLLDSRLPHEAVTLGSSEYNAWETAGYREGFGTTVQIRATQVVDQLETIYPYRVLWQLAAGMTAGIWWYRHADEIDVGASTPAAIGLAGIACCGAATYYGTRSGYDARTLAIAQTATYVGGAALAASATITASRCREHVWNRGAGGFLAAYGRRSLTAYLAATAMLAATAQGWGLRVHSRLDAEETIAVTILSIGISVGIAGMYLHRKSRNGGAEGALRLATRLLAGRRTGRRRRPKDAA